MQRQTEHIYRSFVRVFSSDIIIVAAVDVFSQRTPPSVPTIPERPSQASAPAGVHFAVAHLPQTSATATNWPPAARATALSESKARGKILFVVMYMHVQEKYPPNPSPYRRSPTPKVRGITSQRDEALPMRLQSRPSGHGQSALSFAWRISSWWLLGRRRQPASGWCVHLCARLRSGRPRTRRTWRFASCRVGVMGVTEVKLWRFKKFNYCLKTELFQVQHIFNFRRVIILKLNKQLVSETQ